MQHVAVCTGNVCVPFAMGPPHVLHLTHPLTKCRPTPMLPLVRCSQMMLDFLREYKHNGEKLLIRCGDGRFACGRSRSANASGSMGSWGWKMLHIGESTPSQPAVTDPLPMPPLGPT